MVNGMFRSFFGELMRLLPNRAGFGPEVYKLIGRPIPIAYHRGEELFVTIDASQQLKTPLGDQLQLQFRVGRQPLAKQDVGFGQLSPGPVKVSLDEDGESHPFAPVFQYTFSSNNSLDDNLANLREFVVSQFEKGADPPMVVERHL